jgi:hypothetical protein
MEERERKQEMYKHMTRGFAPRPEQITPLMQSVSKLYRSRKRRMREEEKEFPSSCLVLNIAQV